MRVQSRTLSSRRFNRWLLVVGALVLAAGVIAILVTKVGNNSGTTENVQPDRSSRSAQLEKARRAFGSRRPRGRWPNSSSRRRPARKNLAQAYALADDNVRGGLTLAQWKTGNIPVPYFPTTKDHSLQLEEHELRASARCRRQPAPGSDGEVGAAKRGHS